MNSGSDIRCSAQIASARAGLRRVGPPWGHRARPRAAAPAGDLLAAHLAEHYPGEANGSAEDASGASS
jgi:hypothetical protein